MAFSAHILAFGFCKESVEMLADTDQDTKVKKCLTTAKCSVALHTWAWSLSTFLDFNRPSHTLHCRWSPYASPSPNPATSTTGHWTWPPGTPWTPFSYKKTQRKGVSVNHSIKWIVNSLVLTIGFLKDLAAFRTLLKQLQSIRLLWRQLPETTQQQMAHRLLECQSLQN